MSTLNPFHPVVPSQADGRPGLTQPFVRSLFSKQQQGRGRHVDSKGVSPHSHSRGGKASSPGAPSPAEADRMAKLEEELAKIQHVRRDGVLGMGAAVTKPFC